MTYFRGASAAATTKPVHQRKLKPCAACGKCWRNYMLDECVACGLGGGTPGICPKCMREHRCGKMGSQTS